ncbi:dUTP diphosphatase [bacterium]|nr:dUTP diphosphatase [candidate division CSSED10-310 bacterium]
MFKESVCKDLPLPDYATKDSVGLDLCAAVESSVVISPGTWRLISTGIRIALPKGYEAQVRPRSGLALKYGVTLLNSPGTIDTDYRGIIGVILINHGEEPFTVKRGDRIAQMIIAPVAKLAVEEVSFIRPTERGSNGFGSTGIDLSSDDSTDSYDTTQKRKGGSD